MFVKFNFTNIKFKNMNIMEKFCLLQKKALPL